MSATPATVFGVQMTAITGNTGGALQSLPNVSLVGGRERRFVERLVLASQVSGTVIGVARLPFKAVFMGISVVTDTSLGSSTIKFGDALNGNSAIYGAATTLTATDTPTAFTKTAVHGVELANYSDCVSGLAVSPTAPGEGGALYEDIIMTIGAATMPSSGNMAIIVAYMLD